LGAQLKIKKVVKINDENMNFDILIKAHFFDAKLPPHRCPAMHFASLNLPGGERKGDPLDPFSRQRRDQDESFSIR
jgi:hypothetical protein